jgi:ABC-type transport system involved in multi-copper enzyme maturation permease subunit
MSTLAHALPTRSLVSADLLKLRKRRGLQIITALLTLGSVIVTYAVVEGLHLSNAARHGVAGGTANLGNGATVVMLFGTVAAVIVASMAGSGDLDSKVYRDLVVTGRSRLALYLSRIPAGFLFLLPFVAVAYALAAVATVVFAGGTASPSTTLLVETGLWVVAQVGFYYLLALGLSCLIGRSYTIGTMLAWVFAVTPLLGAISALGTVRRLVPGVALDNLIPSGLPSQGSQIAMSPAAVAAVLIVWAGAMLVLGAWRDTRRDA